MCEVVGVIRTDLHCGALGHERDLRESLGPLSVVGWTLQRALRVRGVARWLLVHPTSQTNEVTALLNASDWLNGAGNKIVTTAVADEQMRPSARVVAARRWSAANWRGGLGGMTCFDELLPAEALVQALQQHGGDAVSAYVLGADWPMHDPALADAVIDLHRPAPEKMKICFTQAPPGLAGCVITRQSLEAMAKHDVSFGQILSYDPRQPRGDAIDKEVCHAVAPQVRQTVQRFIHDTPRSVALLQATVEQLPANAGPQANALQIAQAAQEALQQHGRDHALRFGPQEVELEITVVRDAPEAPADVQDLLLPQAHIAFDRPNMELQQALPLFEQLATWQTPLVFAGVGDATWHPQFAEMVQSAADAGVRGIGVVTDLLGNADEIQRLCELPLDWVQVDLHADRAATYERVTRRNCFRHVLDNISRFLKTVGVARPPWLVPRLTKTRATLGDLESFFDRWQILAGHVLIDSPPFADGLMPVAPLANMTCGRPPHIEPPRQFTILSNGRVTPYADDWLEQHQIGNAYIDTLSALWATLLDHAPQPLLTDA